jgi:hypothetical protein
LEGAFCFRAGASPRLPRTNAGAERVPDGQRCFTIEQASARWCTPAADLERTWNAFFSDCLPEVDAAITLNTQTERFSAVSAFAHEKRPS